MYILTTLPVRKHHSRAYNKDFQMEAPAFAKRCMLPAIVDRPCSLVDLLAHRLHTCVHVFIGACVLARFVPPPQFMTVRRYGDCCGCQSQPKVWL